MNFNDYSDDKNSDLEDYDKDGVYLWDDKDPPESDSNSDHLGDDFDKTFKSIREKEADYIENKPMCPLCGKVLIMRPSNFNEGEFWWGCSGFPDCTYKVNEKNNGWPLPKYEKHSYSNFNNKKESPKNDEEINFEDIFGWNKEAKKDMRCKPEQANNLKGNLKNKTGENIVNDTGEINFKKGKSNNKFILYCFYFVFGISVVCFFIAIIVVLINIFGYFIK